tara:strand:+ start:807 stop:1583 length:777 start_codon:yes stop_codon:yes gene_type:complete
MENPKVTVVRQRMLTDCFAKKLMRVQTVSMINDLITNSSNGLRNCCTFFVPKKSPQLLRRLAGRYIQGNPLIFRIIFLLFISFIAACSDTSTTDDATNDLVGENVGEIKSLNKNVVNLSGTLNSWGITRWGDRIEEIQLKSGARLNHDIPDDWVLTIRHVPDEIGVFNSNDIQIHLFQDYMSECCVNPDDAIGSYETYSRVYTVVAGSINIVSAMQGNFDLYFQEEAPARSGNTLGETVNIIGCWNIGGEYQDSGCQL